MRAEYVDQIASIVESLGLSIGDRLPGERILAERMGCSRNTVREALLSLAAQGRLEIRGRSGSYLSSPGEAEGWETLRDSAEAAPAAHETLLLLGPLTAALAAPRCTPEKDERLRSITARLGRMLVNGETASTVSEYLRFFKVLADIAANPFLQLLMRELGFSQALSTCGGEMGKAEMETFFALHVNLLQALQERDAKHCAVLAERCLDAFSALLGRPNRAELFDEDGEANP